MSVGGGRPKATPCYCSRIVHLIFLTGSLNGTQSLTICLGWPVVKHKEPPVSVSPTLWYNCPLLCCLLHGYWPSNSGPRACNSHTLLIHFVFLNVVNWRQTYTKENQDVSQWQIIFWDVVCINNFSNNIY